MNLHSYEGKQYYFDGYKKIKDDKGLDMWSDTTTLYITVYDGKDEKAEVVGKGILKIATADFATQMTTMTALNTSSKLDALNAVKSFGTLFSKEVFDTYFKKLLSLAIIPMPDFICTHAINIAWVYWFYRILHP